MVPDWKVEESDVKDVDADLIGRYTVALTRQCGRHEYMSNQNPPKEWITTTQATAYLGVSTKTMSRLIRDGVIKTHDHPLDRRKKLVRFADVAELKAQVDRLAA
jgi:excisionase family DNA binding protein